MTAATGNRISTNTVLSNRPVTGGMARRKTKPSTLQTNVVQNAAYYGNLLQSKTNQILEEMDRLRNEIGGEDARQAMEKKLEGARQEVKVLETQLWDYQTAKEAERSGVTQDDLQREIHKLQVRNKRLENEVDGIYLTRKRNEDEIARLQSDRGEMNQEFAVQKLISEIENIHEEERAEEEKMVHLSKRLQEINSNLPKEEEDRRNDLKRNIAQLEEESHLLGVNNNTASKYLLDKEQQMQELLADTRRMENDMKDLVSEQRELRSQLRTLTGGAEVPRLDKMKEIGDAKAKLENDRLSLTAAIESLQEQISAAQKLSECPMPSKNEVELMKEESVFTDTHLQTNQDTVNRLQKQKLAHMEELQRISQLEKKMDAEMEELARRMNKMKSEMEQSFDVAALKDDAGARREDLAERCEGFEQRLNHLNGVMDKLRVEYEESSCGEKEWASLQQLMRAVLELKENKKTPYAASKAECLELVQMLNTMILQCNEEKL